MASPQESNTCNIRVNQQTKDLLRHLLENINDKELGAKVRADTVILTALELIEERHVLDLQNGSLTNLDRFELKYRELKKQNPSVSKDELLGQMMNGEFTT